MSTKHWITKLAAFSVMASASLAFAEVGMRDGEDFFRDFKSTKSRAEVRAELEAARAQSTPRSDRVSASQADIGARGVAGSRYSTRTREEVRQELQQHRQAFQPNSPNDIYFGD